MKLNRRRLLVAGASIGLAKPSRSFSVPTIYAPSDLKPVVIASGNGNQFKNGGTVTCVEKAFSLMTGQTDILDALIAGVNIVELDPAETSVGYGGMPNADGIVQLDSCCMHGAKKRAGGVACLEGVRTPSLVAKAVMDQTDHHLIVGKDAQKFARTIGMTIEDDLNTPHSRQMYLEWKRRADPEHYLDPAKRAQAGMAATLQMAQERLIDPHHMYGTINCNGVNAKGEIAGVTTTSGLAFKIPGRVGDSPILGAGLYVDGAVGAAGSTGRGEANLYNLSSFLIVENLRRGIRPKDAGMEALKRIRANTIEKRLLDKNGNPSFSLQFYIVNAKGEHAGVSMYGNPQYAVCTEKGSTFATCDNLL